MRSPSGGNSLVAFTACARRPGKLDTTLCLDSMVARQDCTSQLGCNCTTLLLVNRPGPKTTLCAHFTPLLMQGLGKYAGSTLVAAGDIDWNGATKTIAAPHDTLTIVGGSGMATGATGTIKLAGGQGAVKNIMLFDVTLPKGDRVLDLNSLGKAQAGEASLLVNAEQPSPLSLLFPINAEEGGEERKAGGDNLATELGKYLRGYTRIGAQVKLPVCKNAEFAVEKNPKIGSDAVLR